MQEQMDFQNLEQLEEQNHRFATHCDEVQEYLSTHCIECTLDHFDVQIYLQNCIEIVTEGFFGEAESDEVTHIRISLWYDDPMKFNERKKLREVFLSIVVYRTENHL